MIYFRALSFLRNGLMRLHSLLEPLDLVTGLEKRELLAYLGGKCDPFHIMPVKKGRGTCECPNMIPSANYRRLVACQCNKQQMHLEYMWLHINTPKRCGCGFWFKLYPVAPMAY